MWIRSVTTCWSFKWSLWSAASRYLFFWQIEQYCACDILILISVLNWNNGMGLFKAVHWQYQRLYFDDQITVGELFVLHSKASITFVELLLLRSNEMLRVLWEQVPIYYGWHSTYPTLRALGWHIVTSSSRSGMRCASAERRKEQQHVEAWGWGNQR